MTNALRWPSTGRLFLYSVLAGTTAVLAMAAWSKLQGAGMPQRPAVQAPATAAQPALKLANGVGVQQQLAPADLAGLRAGGYATVIDLRPDGEVAGQPPSTAMSSAAQAAGLRFRYVPVPHGEIPESAVEGLQRALAEEPGPVLLYCRSGRRAARTWALVEARRVGGLPAEAILEAVRNAGQDAADLRPRIEAAVAARKGHGGAA